MAFDVKFWNVVSFGCWKNISEWDIKKDFFGRMQNFFLKQPQKFEISKTKNFCNMFWMIFQSFFSEKSVWQASEVFFDEFANFGWSEIRRTSSVQISKKLGIFWKLLEVMKFTILKSLKQRHKTKNDPWNQSDDSNNKNIPFATLFQLSDDFWFLQCLLKIKKLKIPTQFPC